MKKTIFLFSLLISSYACSAMQIVDISGIDKKMLLQSLYTHAKPLEMQIYPYIPNHILTDQVMESILAEGRGRIYYLHGRAMKIDISDDVVNTYLYNRHNGTNAAEKIIDALRSKL